eukprot:GILK01000788.1.p1 GENE.GILK01000788.1~~GILK01000788.1.p1  ORF type:complete len:507 (+),score=90.14 GILK01000788.1:51-1523(+)
MSSTSAVANIDNWIGGSYSAPSTAQYLDVTSPATNAVIGRVALSSAADVDNAVQVAKAAYVKWGAQTVKTRATIMFKLHHLIQQHQDELADLIVLEHGKNKLEAIAEVQKGNETCEWACAMPQMFQGKILEVSRGVVCHETRESIGVVASIVPFNFPFMVPFWTIPIALCSGNAMILKPSEKVPLTMHRVAQLIKEAGVPDGVFQIVNGAVDVVNALCDHPDIKAVSFVGSSKVAELVSHRGRVANKKVLALGGAKNHLVALPDADIEMTANDIVASFTGCAGQRCMAASALLVVGQQDELVKRIVDKAAALQPGQSSGQVGPVIDDQSKCRIVDYINKHEASGGSILLDGRSWCNNATGHWVGPTVLLHTSASEPAMQDEIFGPVISILRVSSHEEAIEIENANPYGNAACIYTSIGAHAQWFTSRFRAGMIGVNIGVPVPREPFSFGGWYRSRFGDLDITGEGGMDFFTQKRKVTTKWVPPQERNWMS